MKEQVEELLTKNEVLLKGHFLLTSGLHSEFYFEKFKVLEKPRITSLLCSKIALQFSACTIDRVIGPTTGGIILAYEVARQLGTLMGMAEEDGKGGRIIRRGTDIKEREEILIVDDVLTTGGSLKATIDAVLRKKGSIAGIAVLIDRREKTLDIDYPIYGVYRKLVKNFSESDCPLCRKGISLTQKGKIKEVK